MRDIYRTVGALTGLAAGLALMWALGLGGMLVAAVFGAGGTVVGGMTGERIFDRGGR